MNVSLENKDKVNALLTVKLEKAASSLRKQIIRRK